MRKETTYNKYKRERKELMQLVDIDIRNFALGQNDFANRLNFLKKLVLLYRQEQTKELKKHKTDGEGKCKCGVNIPRGYGYYVLRKPIQCFFCGRTNIRSHIETPEELAKALN